MTNESTRRIIHWALSRPVLAQRLRMIAVEGITDQDQELACTVADLLDPARTELWAEYLKATGADLAEADALWDELDGTSGIYAVDWPMVRKALLELEVLDS